MQVLNFVSVEAKSCQLQRDSKCDIVSQQNFEPSFVMFVLLARILTCWAYRPSVEIPTVMCWFKEFVAWNFHGFLCVFLTCYMAIWF